MTWYACENTVCWAPLLVFLIGVQCVCADAHVHVYRGTEAWGSCNFALLTSS